MTAAAETVRASDHRRCGCCGRELPIAQVVELGSTPGVFICAPCALWAARRAGPLAALRRIRRPRWRRRHPDRGALSAIPILPSSDLDRTAAFYRPVGFIEAGRFDGYLLLASGSVELHFSAPGAGGGQCFVHVGDSLKLWKELRHLGVEGVGDVSDQDYGLREFVLTDPDGNQVRFGSPLPSR